ncbi:juvenile hormone esterase-like isoform X1 [Bacillus rossius redtenbacheri]|uniref:juvenile hormone esterase-like isoform X1 n=1 Tax=Bacillus rossius redtenbacheri TaxID=93214 RepID=UPI002FDED7DC
MYALGAEPLNHDACREEWGGSRAEKPAGREQQKLLRRPAMRSATVVVLALAVVGGGGGGGGGARHREAAGDQPVVRTAQGRLKGSVMQSRLGRNIYAFRGVRFAEPPLGELRFKLPDEGTHRKMSVMVFFHPGAFYGFTGHSAMFGPQYLMDQDIVLVTCNYRLGALGFLSMGDSVLPGNYAMKDQVAVLRWVRQNIGAFGGDPDSVTIAGYSAGARSVMLHMVSPMSQGLFHCAIAMSGSALTYSQNVDPAPTARKLARYFNCSAETSESIRRCLGRQDAQDLASALNIYREFAWDPIVVFLPVVEMANPAEEQFLTANALELFLAGNFSQVPFITGMTEDELAWKSLQILANSNWTEEVNNDYEQVYPISFLYERETQRSRFITNELRRFYLNNMDLENTTYNGLGLIYSDALVGYGVHTSSKVLPARSSKPVYYYKFTYPGRYSFVHLDGTTQPFGIVHHDDLIYLFHISLLFPLLKENDPEILMVERLTKLWANFIQTRDPTPERSEIFNYVRWEPITTRNTNYLHQGVKMEMKQGLFQDRMNLWDRLFPVQM